MKDQEVFCLVRASLFTNEQVDIPDWNVVFTEMKYQSIAALPCEWLKTNLPEAKPWSKFCYSQQGQWVRVMYGQTQLIQLLEMNSIPSVIIKGSAAAMYYPHPMLRSMGDVDFLVKRCDFKRTASILEANGYALYHDKNPHLHHYGYSKDKINFELHKRLGIVSDADKRLLTLFEKGIDNREWRELGGHSFPVMPWHLNGLVLIFHINQHLRSGLGLRQIIDWMMYVSQLSVNQWEKLIPLLKRTGMYRLAITTTAMCHKYLGLNKSLSGIEEADEDVCDKLLSYIMEKGNFGSKAGLYGKTASFSLTSVGISGFFRRLQVGGLIQWKAAKKYPILRPFAWIYQSIRILTILFKSRITPKEFIMEQAKGKKQRKLIKALGLQVDRMIKFDR